MRLDESFKNQCSTFNKVLCASSYGHFIARIEFCPQCHRLLLYKSKYIGPKGSRATGSRGQPKGQGVKGPAQGPKGSRGQPKGQGFKGLAQGPKPDSERPAPLPRPAGRMNPRSEGDQGEPSGRTLTACSPRWGRRISLLWD